MSSRKRNGTIASGERNENAPAARKAPRATPPMVHSTATWCADHPLLRVACTHALTFPVLISVRVNCAKPSKSGILKARDGIRLATPNLGGIVIESAPVKLYIGRGQRAPLSMLHKSRVISRGFIP